MLDLDYLKELTIVVYQIKLSRSYIQNKLQREGTEIFELDEFRDEPDLIRVRIYSCFRNNNTKYQLWVQFQLPECNDKTEEPIRDYYCIYKTGVRTLGTCGHIARVI